MSKVILTVDDEPAIGMALKAMLEKYYTIVQYDNASKGFELASKQVSDLIISDIRMPGADGFEFCEQLKNNISPYTKSRTDS